MKASGKSPMPRNIQPMLATLSDKPFDNPAWLFELKMDGIRALVCKEGGRIDMWTRNARQLSNRFPVLAKALTEVAADSVILDGEIVALDEKGYSHFSLIQPRIHLTRAHDIAEADVSIPVYFYAFDLLYLNGFNLMAFPLLERKSVLRQLLAENGGWVRYNDHVEEHGEAFFDAVTKHKLEGIVAKRADSPYQPGRSRHWLKIKTQHTDHFVIGGLTPPEGSRKLFGALLLGLYNRDGALVYVGRAGGGFDDKTLAAVYRELKPLVTAKSPFEKVPAELKRSTWLKPERICEVRFNEWTPDRKLRAPVFQGLRDDMDPKQCTLEDSVPSEPRLPEPQAKSDPAPIPVTPAPRPAARKRSTGKHGSNLDTRVELTNQDKIYWPEDKLTKGDLVRYYDRIAPYIQPHLQDRPLVFDRYPDGIHGQHFYQKDAHDYTPEWIRTEKLWSPDVERYIRYFIGADREQLIYIANMGAITQNPWSSRLQFLDYPDYAIFDLDPVDAEFHVAQEVAIVVREVLDELQLRSYPKTSGASGIHVYLPVLENTFTYDDVRIFAEAVASIVVSRVPELATIERVVKKRKAGTIYVDYLQNVRGKTIASVYSPRAVPGASVSTPLLWEEFKRPINPKDYTMASVFDRLAKHGDLFAPTLTDRQDISGFLGALRKRR
jgi:bifunctional non-homologous end joining protein LigD